jgi:hypothetical protein
MKFSDIDNSEPTGLVPDPDPGEEMETAMSPDASPKAFPFDDDDDEDDDDREPLLTDSVFDHEL